MPIYQSKKSMQQEQLTSFTHSLNSMLHMHKKMLNEFSEINNSFKLLQSHTVNFKFDESPIKQLNGAIAQPYIIKDLLVEAAGHNSNNLWQIIHTEPHIDIDSLKSFYGVDFFEKDIVTYTFSRPTNKENEIHLVIVTPLPGYFDVEVRSHLSNFKFDCLVTKKELLENLKEEFSL